MSGTAGGRRLAPPAGRRASSPRCPATAPSRSVAANETAGSRPCRPAGHGRRTGERPVHPAQRAPQHVTPKRGTSGSTNCCVRNQYNSGTGPTKATAPPPAQPESTCHQGQPRPPMTPVTVVFSEGDGNRGKWHATAWLPSTGARSGGSSSAQRGWASGQRVRTPDRNCRAHHDLVLLPGVPTNRTGPAWRPCTIRRRFRSRCTRPRLRVAGVSVPTGPEGAACGFGPESPRYRARRRPRDLEAPGDGRWTPCAQD